MPEEKLERCKVHNNVWTKPNKDCWVCDRNKLEDKQVVTIDLTNEELSILKQLLRREGEEFTRIQMDKTHKAVYTKVMQTQKTRYKKETNNVK